MSVRDFGPGVRRRAAAAPGRAFYRADARASAPPAASGLGLYLCRLVAQAHGGELRFANAEPGLEVELVLPL